MKNEIIMKIIDNSQWRKEIMKGVDNDNMWMKK